MYYHINFRYLDLTSETKKDDFFNEPKSDDEMMIF